LPDCTLTVAQVYTRAAVEIAAQGDEDGAVQSLEFLSCVQDIPNRNTVFHSEFDSNQSFKETAGDAVLNIGRRFFVSTSGFAWLVPGQSRPGDEIYILFGANVPFVIPRDGQRYSFLGECSVLGLMAGEAMEEFPLDRVEDLVLVRIRFKRSKSWSVQHKVLLTRKSSRLAHNCTI